LQFLDPVFGAIGTLVRHGQLFAQPFNGAFERSQRPRSV
jgi:hypothetical protein